MSVCVCPRCFWSLNTWNINVAAMEKEHIPLVLPARQMQLEYSTIEPFQPIAVVVDGTNPSKPQFLGFVFLVTCNGHDFLAIEWLAFALVRTTKPRWFAVAMLGYRLNSTAISDCPTQLSFFASCPVAVMYHEARFCFLHQGGESVYMGVFALKIANWIRSLLTSRSVDLKKKRFRGNFQTNLYLWLYISIWDDDSWFTPLFAMFPWLEDTGWS